MHFRIKAIGKFLWAGLILTTGAAKAQQPKAALLPMVNNRLAHAAEQYRYFMKQVPPDSFPETFNPSTGRWAMGGTKSWMCGFYPGALLYLFEATHDSTL